LTLSSDTTVQHLEHRYIDFHEGNSSAIQNLPTLPGTDLNPNGSFVHANSMNIHCLWLDKRD